MFKNITVKNTVVFSLLVQVITGIISLHGLFITLPEKDKILTDVFKLETVVQFIELMFYIWIAKSAIKLKSMTSRRYIDWVITTPTMLLSTVMFMRYQEVKEQDKLEDTPVRTMEFLKENKTTITFMLIYNFAMLVLGYLGERNILSKYISTPVGFYFFYKSFSIIYFDFAKKSELGTKLFTFLLSIWSLYGVAAVMPVKLKNISYNLLDIVAKNFYGLYIYYKIVQTSKGN